MASTTSNLGLTKPAYTDDADIGDLNGNFDLIDAEAGRVRANFAGTYSTSSAYAVGAYVIYQGNLYKCTTAIGSGGEAWNSAHWDQVSVGTELTAMNDHISNIDNTLTTTLKRSGRSSSSDLVLNTAVHQRYLIICGVGQNSNTSNGCAYLLVREYTNARLIKLSEDTGVTLTMSQNGNEITLTVNASPNYEREIRAYIMA